ncbi:hypothetical protein GCM10011505_43190 [Tistrella bauzanensis]|uniref:Methyltransferase type 11 domain-containing protein n=1 Tax=Tistrella bauzanensis TaxID=657419 RepID=A0ABQ1J199_9PROT|nr:class I SAM-dependent methyltransferase [Tistrella bauzanensis]GGB57668.1 hypothetical protein GCM10011505_43190 [Tistrella bauzanensis]
MIRTRVKKVLPPWLFRALRDLPYAVQDMVTPRPAGALAPPLRLMYEGPRGYDVFIRNGLETAAFYRQMLGMEPDDRVLDIGCGIGRKTVPLLDLLDARGLYVRMDLDPRGIDWCTRHISTRNPRFCFFTMPVYNRFYNPRGRLPANRFVFPFPDNAFDKIVLWSVFTHMYPGDIDHYLSEISRILVPGGVVCASYYIMNETARAAIHAGRARHAVTHALGDCWTTNPNIPEDLIAVDDVWLRAAHHRHALTIAPGDLLPDNWTGNDVAADRTDARTAIRLQDVVIARKL